MAQTTNRFHYIIKIIPVIVTTPLFTQNMYEGDFISFSCGSTDLAAVIPTLLNVEWILNGNIYKSFLDADLNVMDEIEIDHAALNHSGVW